MTCKDCLHGELCMSRTDTTPFTKTEYRDLDNVEKFCEDFKNKADYVEVVRCQKCKHGDVSTFSLSKDGEEYIRCYCSLKNAVTNVDYFCSDGERKTDNDL